jgi:putative transposase
MPRRPRSGTGGLVFHVYNRTAGRITLFQSAADYSAFERIITEANEHVTMRLLSYALMPTHWHLVLWPFNDTDLSRYMHWLALTHVRRWQVSHGTLGTGALYQGRFKAIPVQDDRHFLIVCAYVERNPVRRGLVTRAQDWPWSSAWQERLPWQPVIDTWPVPKPTHWPEMLAADERPRVGQLIRSCIRRGIPFGDRRWRTQALEQMDAKMRATKRGRPKVYKPPD